jgi:hypothetical protein
MKEIVGAKEAKSTMVDALFVWRGFVPPEGLKDARISFQDLIGSDKPLNLSIFADGQPRALELRKEVQATFG